MQSKLQIFEKYKFQILIIFSFSFLSILFYQTQSLISHDEAIYASRARLILEENNWFTPFDGMHHKTVGAYWVTALSLKIFGFNEFSARLPSLIFSIISCFFLQKIYVLLNKNYKQKYIPIILINSTPIWFIYGHYCSPDMLFVLINLIPIFFLLKINNNVNLNESNNLYPFLDREPHLSHLYQ